MAYRSRLARVPTSPTSTASMSLSWEPRTTDSLFSSFPGGHLTRSPVDPPSAVSVSSYAGLTDLPDELLLSIMSLLYLPPTEYSSAHERNTDLCSLGLAGGPRIQLVVRGVLFEHTTLQTDKQARWLLRRPHLMPPIRSLTLQTSPLLLHLPLLLDSLPKLASLILNCKLTTPMVTTIFLPLLRAGTAPALLALDLAFAERLSSELVLSIVSCLPPSLQRLGMTTLFMDGGLLSEVVSWEDDEIEDVLALISTKAPDLITLSLPVHLLPPSDPSTEPDDPPRPLEPYRELWGIRAQTLFAGTLRELRLGGWTCAWDSDGKELSAGPTDPPSDCR